MIVERTIWVPVRDERILALGEGEMVYALIRGRGICWVRMNGRLHAMEDRCPHQGASLSKGWCENGLVVCPLHRYRFDPTTGRCRDGEGERAPVYPVEERPDGPYLGLTATGFRLFGFDLW